MNNGGPIDSQAWTTGIFSTQNEAHKPGDSTTISAAYTEVHSARDRLTASTSAAADITAVGQLRGVLVSAEGGAKDFVEGLGQSFVYSLVQSPLEGLSDTFDHTLGKVGGSNLYAKTKDLITTAPKPADFGSAEWHGQAIGGALGIIPWFVATRAVLRGGAGLSQATKRLVVSEAEAATGSKVLSSTGGKMILESGTTAAVYAGAFKPIGSDKSNYWSAKSGQMIGDFATFATLRASSIYIGTELKARAVPLLEKYPQAPQLTPRSTNVLAGGLSGIPAAGVDTVWHHDQSGRNSAVSLSDFAKNAYSFAVVGATLGAVTAPTARASSGQGAKQSSSEKGADNGGYHNLSGLSTTPQQLFRLPSHGQEVVDSPQPPAGVAAPRPVTGGPPWAPRRAPQRLELVDLTMRIDKPSLPNFAAVSDTTWRSGQFAPEGLSELKQLGAKTIVNLQPQTYFGEAETAQQLGLRYFHVPINENKPLQNDTAKLIETIAKDPENYPIVWHCWYGQDRTGAATALARTSLGELSASAAIDEMLAFGVHDKHKIFHDSVRQYLTGSAEEH